MDSKGNLCSLFGLFVCLSMLYTANGMMCEIRHPQTAVCNAAYVIKAEILNINWKNNTANRVQQANPFAPRVIQARLVRLYKGHKAVNASKGDLIYISYPPYWMSIKEGEMYLLTGSSTGTKLQLNLCDWFSRWQDLTESQKFGVKRYYYWIYCRCRIEACYSKGCTTTQRPERVCYVSPSTLHCNGAKNICMVRNGRCDWDSPRGRTVCQDPSVPSLP